MKILMELQHQLISAAAPFVYCYSMLLFYFLSKISFIVKPERAP